MTKAQQKERDEARTELRKHIKPGDTVYTVLHHVSRSGMQREIGVVLLSCDNGEIISLHPNYLVSKALSIRQGKRDGLIMGGCGMDMGFALVHQLSYALFPDSFECIGEKCPSNDHNNGDRDRTPHKHSSGGYAIKQRWMPGT
jgi:hypothetical protein